MIQQVATVALMAFLALLVFAVWWLIYKFARFIFLSVSELERKRD